MISRKQIADILTVAVRAPSGDNSQPWTFSISSDNTLRIFNVEGKDNPILNYQNSGSYVAHGALIANIKILSGAFKFKTSVSYFPEIENCVAEITFSDSEGSINSNLMEAIDNRASNRKHYKNKPLNQTFKDALIASANTTTSKSYFSLSSDAADKKKVGRALSTMENVALQVPELHHLFFSDIIWKSSENESGMPGLYIKSLELPPPAQLAMRLLKDWKVTNTLNRYIKLSQKIAGEMAGVYRDSATYGAIFIPNRERLSYVEVGEVMERVWLEATMNNIAVQPVTGLMFLAHRAEAKDLNPIPQSFEPEILDAYKTVKEIFTAPANMHLAFLLRFGHSKAPSARSARLPPVIV